MDKLKPFQLFSLEELSFSPNTYEVYQGGGLIDQGRTSMTINAHTIDKFIIANDNIVVNIINNNIAVR